MTHEDKKYLDEVCEAIKEMKSKPLTPERARCMHDYLYIKKHFTEYAEHGEHMSTAQSETHKNPY